MEVLTPLGDTDPLAASSERHPARTGKSGRLQPERVGRVLGRRAQLRDGPVRVLSQSDIDNSGYPAATDDHDGATCNDHHCRAHWTDVTRQFVAPDGRLLG